MPGGLAGTKEIMTFLAREISKDTYVNVMAQYRPCGEAHDDETLSRPLLMSEFGAAVAAAREAGLHRLDKE